MLNRNGANHDLSRYTIEVIHDIIRASSRLTQVEKKLKASLSEIEGYLGRCIYGGEHPLCYRDHHNYGNPLTYKNLKAWKKEDAIKTLESLYYMNFPPIIPQNLPLAYIHKVLINNKCLQIATKILGLELFTLNCLLGQYSSGLTAYALQKLSVSSAEKRWGVLYFNPFIDRRFIPFCPVESYLAQFYSPTNLSSTAQAHIFLQPKTSERSDSTVDENSTPMQIIEDDPSDDYSPDAINFDEPDLAKTQEALRLAEIARKEAELAIWEDLIVDDYESGFETDSSYMIHAKLNMWNSLSKKNEAQSAAASTLTAQREKLYADLWGDLALDVSDKKVTTEPDVVMSDNMDIEMSGQSLLDETVNEQFTLDLEIMEQDFDKCKGNEFICYR